MQNRQTQKGSRPGAPQKPYQVQYHRSSTAGGVAAVLVMMICVSLCLLVVKSVDWDLFFADGTRRPFENEENQAYGPDLTAAERDAYITQYITVKAEDVHKGSCILVNNTHEYRFPSEEETDATILSVFRNKTYGYKVKSGKEYLHTDAIDALNAMMDDFYASSGSRDVMVNSAYRTKEDQQVAYDDYVKKGGVAYADAYVQKPGFSEHHTGYAVDFAIYEEYEDGKSAIWAFDGKGKYFWVNKNCTQYGYILRYSANKEDVTGISYESWHFRYIGRAHAIASSELGLALEEYISYVKDYRYEDTKYYTRANDGAEYCIYFVPANGQATQQIPVPRNALSYDISGNNEDGFIVSALVGYGEALQEG